jgi:hypothetical protein
VRLGNGNMGFCKEKSDKIKRIENLKTPKSRTTMQKGSSVTSQK